MTKREGLAMVYALQKFRNYLLGGHFKMFTDHSSLQYLVNNPVLGGRIYRWFLLFQEFDFEIVVKSGWLNAGGPYHLSHVVNGEEPTNIDDGFQMCNCFGLMSQMITMHQLFSFCLLVSPQQTCRLAKRRSWS